jgi:sodium-dependent phosphate cotransporter
MKTWLKWLRLIAFLYTFILSIELIKKSLTFLEPIINNFLIETLSPIKAIAVGWFFTSLAQSSGAVSSLTSAFAGQGLLDIQTAVYILVGASLGTTITSLVISLLTTSKSKTDFRHGFEIALCYSIYSALLVIVVLILEGFFGLFSKTSLYLAEFIQPKISYLQIPNIVETITLPIIKIIQIVFHDFALLILGFLILIFSLKFLGKSVVQVLGGELKARKLMNKHFNSPIKIYLIGALLTAIVFSSSITIGLLVPLAVARVISLRKAIPFILGADLGTFTDTFLAAIIIGKPLALATAIAYAFFAIIGAIIFLPNTRILHDITKFSSKRFIKVSRRKALYILIAFVLVPLLIILLT